MAVGSFFGGVCLLPRDGLMYNIWRVSNFKDSPRFISAEVSLFVCVCVCTNERESLHECMLVLAEHLLKMEGTLCVAFRWTSCTRPSASRAVWGTVPAGWSRPSPPRPPLKAPRRALQRSTAATRNTPRYWPLSKSYKVCMGNYLINDQVLNIESQLTTPTIYLNI